MNRFAATAWVAVALFLGGEAARAGDPPSERYLVKFRPEVSDQRGWAELEAQGLKVRRLIAEISVYLAEAEDPARFARRGLPALEASPDVLYIEPSRVFRAFRTVPNDPLYPQQNEHRRLELEDAWDCATGDDSVVVAVSDSGVDARHPDFAGQIYVNPGEIPGNGVDDDRNGLVDDVRGWDFFAGDADPADENRHGTHVAGIVAARGDDGVGVAGVSWRASILPVRFLNAAGQGSTEGGIDTIVYAARQGARVINASWGGGAPSRALEDAIRFAFDRGALLVAAAGNDARDTDRAPAYPADYELPGVLSVASSQADGVLSSFSNFGAFSVDFAAPGSNVLSTLPAGNWGRLSGTSMAAPMASGVAALVLARRPGLSATDLRNALLNATYERAGYHGRLSTAGELSALRAVAQLDEGFQVWPARLTLAEGREHRFTAYDAQGTVAWSVSDARAASIDAQGTLRANRAGSIQVRARDASGRVAATEWVSIVAVGGGGGGPGCATAPRAPGEPVDPGALVSLGLPLFVAAWTRRRRVY
jgi:subtilisin family serine protease